MDDIVFILYIVGLFAILYFLFIRPQQVRQKKHLEMVNNLQVNDPVITAGGIYGVIRDIKEESIILKIAEDVEIELMKNSVAQVRGTTDIK